VGPLLAFFPHPDDETFCAAGVMTAAVALGAVVTVVSATRGEAGDSSIPGLDDPDALGAVREAELREAMRRLGVGDVRLLGFRDSGLGDEPREDRRIFTRVPVAEVVATLVPIIRETRPGVVLTFGPDGMYGHPDHLHAHEIGVQAVIAAADPIDDAGTTLAPWETRSLYFATIPREDMLAMLERPNSPLEFVPVAARANLGTPRADITHAVDIRPWASAKHAAIEAHRTQTGEGGPLASIPPEERNRRLEREYFVKFPLPWDRANDENDIIAELARRTDSR
jgi:N-acetyl-1-D-myo-inositol-2-amino-2-deoxy-alpha-D-glucopyranoside deacetylase